MSRRRKRNSVTKHSPGPLYVLSPVLSSLNNIAMHMIWFCHKQERQTDAKKSITRSSLWHTSWLGGCWQNTPEGFIDKGSSELGVSLCLVGPALAREKCLWGCVRGRRCLNKSSTVPLQCHSSESHAVKDKALNKYLSCKKKAYKSQLLHEQIYVYQSQKTRTRSLPAWTEISKVIHYSLGTSLSGKAVSPTHSLFLLSMVPTSCLDQ